MSILIVDDEQDIRFLLEKFLNKAGYTQQHFAASTKEACEKLKQLDHSDLELILLDIMMPDKDGIEALACIKNELEMPDIPVIMVTALSDVETLERAFNAGAVDYITKPVRRVELNARVNSVINLYREKRARVKREKELEEALNQLAETNEKLETLATIDELTQLPNRRLLNETLQSEWKRARRNGAYLSLIILDIDYFKNYNDTYGHQKGDECLRTIAGKLDELMLRPGDFAARYGGEEFAVILPGADRVGAVAVAERIRVGIHDLGIPHADSSISEYVTVSLGTATVKFDESSLDVEVSPPAQTHHESGAKSHGSSEQDEERPSPKKAMERFMETADAALYDAKGSGRNRVEHRLL